jgi:hypothetical protein
MMMIDPDDAMMDSPAMAVVDISNCFAGYLCACIRLSASDVASGHQPDNAEDP